MSTASTTRCRERVPDNGDCYACDNPLPCPDHPAEHIDAGEALRAIHGLLDVSFKLDESRADRVRAVARVVDEFRAKHPGPDDPLARLLQCARTLDAADRADGPGTDEAHEEAECAIWSAAIEWSRTTPGTDS